MPDQIGLPSQVSLAEIAREKTLGGAIELCAKAAGFALDKELQGILGVDKAQFSRWHSGAEGIIWPKFVRLMDVCGNDAPLLWMLHQRGYDITTIRRMESEIECQLRKEREKNAELELKLRVMNEVLMGRAA